MSEIVHTTTLHRDDIPKMLEVAEEVQREADLEQQTQIIVYQEKIETIQKALTALRDQINMYEGLVSATAQWRDETKANKSPLNERAMIACKLFSDKLEKLLAQREGLFAKLDGYNEFIRKLENNEQLEFNL